MDGKIFCIGVNKTGTSSVHQALRLLGYKSVHYLDDQGNNIKAMIESNYLNNRDILAGLEQYDAISDWDYPTHAIAIFKAFDKQYPKSKFILNTREMNTWIESRKNHVLNNQAKKLRNPDSRDPSLEWQIFDIDAWRKEYELRHQEAMDYFKDRKSDLLVFNVSKGDGWEKLCHFLGKPIPSMPFPRVNETTFKERFIARLFSIFFSRPNK